MTDFSELRKLSRDLGVVPEATFPKVVSALKYTGVDLKKDWARGAKRTGLSGYAASIDFDVKPRDGAIAVEVGPNPGKNQGTFGFVEDGGDDVRSAPQHAGRDALERAEPDFHRGLDIAVDEGLRGEGL